MMNETVTSFDIEGCIRDVFTFEKLEFGDEQVQVINDFIEQKYRMVSVADTSFCFLSKTLIDDIDLSWIEKTFKLEDYQVLFSFMVQLLATQGVHSAIASLENLIKKREKSGLFKALSNVKKFVDKSGSVKTVGGYAYISNIDFIIKTTGDVPKDVMSTYFGVETVMMGYIVSKVLPKEVLKTIHGNLAIHGFFQTVGSKYCVRNLVSFSEFYGNEDYTKAVSRLLIAEGLEEYM